MVHKTSFHANTLPFRLATFPCLLAFVSAWITCGRAASQNPPVVRQPHEEMIIYTRGARPNWDVFLIEEEGAAPIRLTDHASLDYGATFSPDAKWVVFTSEREGSADLYAIELEGRRVVRLTRHEAMEDASAFAPDGKSIAFVSNREGNADIFVMPFEPDNPDAESRAVNLTQSRESEFNPAFSPDGRRIAFACASSYTESIGSSICVMNADGSELRHLVWTGDRPLQYGSPVWSADGTRLYFYSGSLDGRPPQILTVVVDDERPTAVPMDGAHGFGPTLTRDGRLVFHVLLLEPTPDIPVYLAIRLAPVAIFSGMLDGTTVKNPKSLVRGYLAPDFDAAGRMVCHGPGPVTGRALMQNGMPFDHADPIRRVKLPDRTIALRGIAARFPSILPKQQRVVATQWIHQIDGKPPGPSAIVAAAVDGTDLKTVFAPIDRETLWAPVVCRNGQWIVFAKGPPMAHGRPDVNVDIWKVRPDGSDATNLTPDSISNDAFPDISADGSRIVFRRDHGETERHIYVMDSDGKHLKQVTSGPGIRTMPAISPDGHWVVYSWKKSDEHGFDLYVQSLENPGSDLRPLEPELAKRSRPGTNSMHARYSPDGRWVVFTSNRAGMSDEWVWCGRGPQPSGELFALPVDGSSPAVRLTYDKWEDGVPYWADVVRPRYPGALEE